MRLLAEMNKIYQLHLHLHNTSRCGQGWVTQSWVISPSLDISFWLPGLIINAGARAPPVLFFSALSFSSYFDRGTYKLSIHNGCYLPWMNNPYITLNKSKQKIRAEKNITDSATRLNETISTNFILSSA